MEDNIYLFHTKVVCHLGIFSESYQGAGIHESV